MVSHSSSRGIQVALLVQGQELIHKTIGVETIDVVAKLNSLLGYTSDLRK